MRKIASPRALQAELQQLLSYCQGVNPSRQVLAEGLKRLAEETVGTEETAAVKTKADFHKLRHQMSADIDTFEIAWGMYDRDPEKNKHKLDDALKYMKDLQFIAGVLIKNMEALKG